MLYRGHCAGCHGPEGTGGRGAALARPALPRAADDSALFQVIRLGIPGTEMPAGHWFGDRDVWRLVAHVRSLGRQEADAIAGDAEKGREIYFHKGHCANCHAIQAKGGRLGPELGAIGASRNSVFLRRALLDPEADLPGRAYLDRRPAEMEDHFLIVRIRTVDGVHVRGLRLNEDPFSIQIRDLSDKLHSFWKSEIAELDRETGKSPMPSYRPILSGEEIDDLVAYLVTLKGDL